MRPNLLIVALLFSILAGCGDRPPQPPSVAELTAMLQNDDPKVQVEAATWIKHLGPKAAETTPALTAALKSPDRLVRQSAAMALGQIGPEAAEAVPALTEALADEDYNVRRVAADALGQMGPAASSAIPALEKLEKLSKKSDPCGSTQSALKKIRS